MAKRKKVLTKKQLDILYECWKEGKDTKERLELIEERMPKVSTLLALKTMRRLAKTDPKWLKWTTRQKNLKEKEKLEKQKEKERKKAERERKKAEREHKKIERTKKRARKNQKEQISKNIDPVLSKELEKHIELELFFCPDTHQYVTNISCIFRIFGGDFSFGGPCDKCKRMDKYIPELKEFFNGRKNACIQRQRSEGDSAGKGRRKVKIEKSKLAEAKVSTRKKNNTKCAATSGYSGGKSGASDRRSR
jgi:hypothetical protein